MKGQVSIEIVAGIVVLLFAFVLVTSYSYERNLNIDAIQKSIESKADCRRIADVISSVYASGEKTSIEFYFEKDFNIMNGFVDVNGFFCNYYGIAEQKFVTKGNVIIKDLNGVVVIENS